MELLAEMAKKQWDVSRYAEGNGPAIYSTRQEAGSALRRTEAEFREIDHHSQALPGQQAGAEDDDVYPRGFRRVRGQLYRKQVSRSHPI